MAERRSSRQAPSEASPSAVTGLFATTGLADGRAKLWTASPMQQLGASFIHPPGAQAGNAAITADGRTLIVVYDDGSGAVWPLSIDTWKRHACAVAGRNLTREEWARFITGHAYRATCRWRNLTLSSKS